MNKKLTEYNNQKCRDALKKSRLADEKGERYGEIEFTGGKVL